MTIYINIARMIEYITKNQLMMYPTLIYLVMKTNRYFMAGISDKVMYHLWGADKNIPIRTISYRPNFMEFMKEYVYDSWQYMNGEKSDKIDLNAILISCLDANSVSVLQTRQPQFFLTYDHNQKQMLVTVKNMPANIDVQTWGKALQKACDCFSISSI